MTHPRVPLVLTEEDLLPQKTRRLLEKRAALHDEVYRRKDRELERVLRALPFRSFEAHGDTYRIRVVAVWDEGKKPRSSQFNRIQRLRGFDLAAMRSHDTTALWSQYIHRTDRIGDEDLRDYVKAAANMLLAKVRWEHD